MSSARQNDHVTLAFLESLRSRCPDHLPLLEALGDMYTGSGRYEEGLAIDLMLTSRFPGNPTYWYNLGCSYARLERIPDALTALGRGIGLGYSDAEWMLRDEDLASVHHHPEFLKLVASLGSTGKPRSA